MKKIAQLPLYIKILSGMVLGIIAGYIFLLADAGNIVTLWIKPWGTIFIKLLKLIAMPLVFISLLKGVTGMKEISQLSKLGLKTIGVYILTTLIAVVLGIGLVSVIQPGKFFPSEKAEAFKKELITDSTVNSTAITPKTPMDYIVDIIPENMISAGGDNSRMLQIIFLAIIIGIAMVTLGSKKVGVLTPIIDAINSIILKIVDFIMNFAPIGVFALMAGLMIDFAGDSDLFAALGMYILTAIIAFSILIFIFYPSLIKLFTHHRINSYLKAIFPIQMLAFSTSSSSATLPFTMEQTQKELGISEETASFVLPVGATINMDGTSCYQAIAILFMAQLLGIDLNFSQLLTVIFLTVLASIGTPGVPGASVVMTIMVMSSVGIPAEGLALILGVDRPLDMMRTVVNVTGDTFVASVLDEKKIAK